MESSILGWPPIGVSIWYANRTPTTRHGVTQTTRQTRPMTTRLTGPTTDRHDRYSGSRQTQAITAITAMDNMHRNNKHRTTELQAPKQGKQRIYRK